MQETRKPQKEEKRSLEKKDTENMEMKKPEEQAKPKKKKIISVVRPQNATSKEAKELLEIERKSATDDRWINHCLCVGDSAGIIAKALKEKMI